MHSIFSFVVLCASVALISSQIFPDNTKLLAEYPPLCSELNSTMFKLIEEFTPKTAPSRMKRSPIDYTFYFNRTEADVLNLNFSLSLEPGQNISSLMPNRTLFVILPINYYVTAYRFTNRSSGFQEEYVLMEGTRCKVQFDKKIGAYEKVVCWEKPSFCRGSETACIMNDDVDHLCFDEASKRGQKPRDDSENVDHFLTEIGEKLYWRSHLKHFIFEDGTYLTANATLNEWKCNENGTSVLCDLIFYGGGAGSVQLLKTIAG